MLESVLHCLKYRSVDDSTLSNPVSQYLAMDLFRSDFYPLPNSVHLASVYVLLLLDMMIERDLVNPWV